jgi:lipopolysaccharide transport system ATP-binding protein
VLRGRVGSLLEIGTGFHPDLTGRENVFLSGALLGLTREKIGKNFDKIVEFSGIGQFIDVPVKRYSSGMYVRLAYSVAANLDTDILILDEVLAVGDAEFTERSKRNIEEVVHGGRTILFVSHSMPAIADVCQHGMVLSAGRCVYQGSATDAVSQYMKIVHHVSERDRDLESAPAVVDLRNAAGWDEGKRDVVMTSVITM